MNDQKENNSSVEGYITSFPPPIQERLKLVRDAIKACVPEETIEKISYQMPSFYLNGYLVYYAGYKNHIGLYPTPSGMLEFSDELSKYQRGKGSAQFPHEQPLPLELIKRIVEFRVDENLKNVTIKKKKDLPAKEFRKLMTDSLPG